MKTNSQHVFSKNRPVARTARALVAAFACAAIGNAVAADWEVYPKLKDGMTGAQQITNALTKLKSGDTIRVNPGTYDFTGIAMSTETKTDSGKTYTITNHLARTGIKSYSLVGVTDGHWDDKVIFKGDARCLDSSARSNCVKIRNITFDGFNGGNFPSGTNLVSRGGALRLTDSSNTDSVSNCVFRNCYAYIGGAVNGGVLTDCLVTRNSAKARGGATCNTGMRDCRVTDNSTQGNSGAFFNHYGLYNTLFENNSCTQSGGAGEHASTQPIANCVFRNNTTTTKSANHGGGAIRCERKKTAKGDFGDIVECRFEGNSAPKSFGGAIYQVDGSDYVSARIRQCEFSGNVSKSEGDGDIYVRKDTDRHSRSQGKIRSQSK